MGELLRGRGVLVVGGGQRDYGQPDPPVGIGRAIAVFAAREGARVAVADVDQAAAEATVCAVREAGGTGYALAGDAAQERDVVRVVGRAGDLLGGLDGISLNVGVASGTGLAGTGQDEWDSVMEINTRSAFLGCKHGIPALSPGGGIVLTSSTAARVVSTSDMPAYVASKAALDGLCRYAAREGAYRGVRVNVVAAGLIDTPLGRLASLVKPDRDAIPVPLGRQGTGWDVAAAVVFLLCDLAGYVTGQTLAVDGGMSNVH